MEALYPSRTGLRCVEERQPVAATHPCAHRPYKRRK
jgi:hypothetical protein